mgnify:CR=1 FL=1
MYKVRTTKTGSGRTAVQIVRRHKRRTEVIKHLGTAANEQEVKILKDEGYRYIHAQERTLPLYSSKELPQLVAIDKLTISHAYHTFALEFLEHFYCLNGFDQLEHPLLRHLSVLRIVEPVSKIKSIELLEQHFGISYTRNRLYKTLPAIAKLQDQAEKQAVTYAKKYLDFDFSLVFYDMTTMYFESFKEDEFRRCGFSKDNKPNQPQILVALVVNQDGYPISCQLFKGNTFEGHTIIPVILELKKKYDIKTITVVADAAMLSLGNINQLAEHKLHYVVAARMGNLSRNILEGIADELNGQENRYIQRETNYGTLLCDYSKKRASKDKSDRNKQLQRARGYLAQPNQKKKRLKFIKETKQATYELNQKLIEKSEKLDGIKGYYTNLDTSSIKPELIISRYKQLWQIEKSFRIAKSDLLARPIYHRKEESIRAHMVIVFVSLCVAKSIELLSGYSIQQIKHYIWKILDVELQAEDTGQTFSKRMQASGNPLFEWFNKIR